MREKNKYTIKEILSYFKRAGILLVDEERIGEVKLPLINKKYILEDDEDGLIKSLLNK
jgi:hypothetical protein